MENDDHVIAESRIFTRNTAAWTTDGSRLCGFKVGERVKNVRRSGKSVFFEPADSLRVVATYTMDWDRFIASTTAVSQVGV